ncbi:MAG TPA: ABC transporter permease [Bacteroidales bacterium]|nr:ABC transporter permease [Bacteroidales bacterium]
MWKNYIKIAWRNILKRKGYAIINITGLSVGMAACIIIIMFIVQELSYDQFHKDAENIYRVPVKASVGGDVFNVAVNSAPAGPGMYNDFPVITNFCRVRENTGEALITFGEKKFYEQQRIHVDSTFFQLFSFKLIRGNPEEALKRPKSVVLTKSVAEKIFGEENPVGKSVSINEEHNYLITGVVADPPVNSHLQFKMLISLSSTESRMGANHFTDNWGSLMYHTYIKIIPNTSPQTINNSLPEWYKKHVIESMADAEVQYEFDFNPYLQPITNIHLHSDLFNEMSANGDIAYVYTFSAIALFILIIAGINYLNLNIAQSLKRSKEVGMRKVHGASRKQLIRQFLAESLMISLFAFILALLLSELALPWFSEMLGYPLGMNLTEHTYLIPSLLVLMLMVGIGSGSYPAFYLSSYQPIAALKKNLYKGKKQNPLSNALVVLQFVISASLIVGAVTIYRQLDFIKNKNLGFDKEHVMVIPVRNNDNREAFKYFKKELGNLSTVRSISAVSNVPGQPLSGNGFTLDDDPSKDQRIIYTITADEDFANTLNMKMVDGRFFSEDFGTDSASAVINQFAAAKFGWKEPIGKKIIDYNADPPIKRTVVGV